MPISEAPAWVREFLEIKAPWWLEGSSSGLKVLEIYEDLKIARVEKDGHIYTLIPELHTIH
jgi:hypothetical protein